VYTHLIHYLGELQVATAKRWKAAPFIVLTISSLFLSVLSKHFGAYLATVIGDNFIEKQNSVRVCLVCHVVISFLNIFIVF
jgi:hypothetical protein